MSPISIAALLQALMAVSEASLDLREGSEQERPHLENNSDKDPSSRSSGPADNHQNFPAAIDPIKSRFDAV